MSSGTLEYRDEPLVPGETHDWWAVARDVAGNESAPSAVARVTVPSTPLWITLDRNDVDLGTAPPGTVTTQADATVARVGGLGGLTYTLSCSGEDFQATDPLSATPVLPVGFLSFLTRGQVALDPQPFDGGSLSLATQSGNAGLWEHDYIFDYSLSTPWAVEPGTYVGKVTYTVLPQ